MSINKSRLAILKKSNNDKPPLQDYRILPKYFSKKMTQYLHFSLRQNKNTFLRDSKKPPDSFSLR